jgi:protocatechuate 3,4-dioxygenase beta subunit
MRSVFQGQPREFGSSVRIAPVAEPGEPLVLEGVVRDSRGRPAPGITVYAYHTDATGVYPPDGRFRGRSAFHHGRLRAWARTDSAGHYRFATIRPGGYQIYLITCVSRRLPQSTIAVIMLASEQAIG